MVDASSPEGQKSEWTIEVAVLPRSLAAFERHTVVAVALLMLQFARLLVVVLRRNPLPKSEPTSMSQGQKLWACELDC